MYLGVHLGVYLGGGICKLFTTGKSHAPAHITFSLQHVLGYQIVLKFLKAPEPPRTAHSRSS